jgi:hypothetical protein
VGFEARLPVEFNGQGLDGITKFSKLTKLRDEKETGLFNNLPTNPGRYDLPVTSYIICTATDFNSEK